MRPAVTVELSAVLVVAERGASMVVLVITCLMGVP